jgi:hypothetical protein
MPERYALRIPFSLGTRVQADELSRIPMWEVISVEVGERPATIERLELYFILRVGGFASENDARHSFDRLGCSLIKWSLQNKATVRYSPVLQPIMTSTDPNRFFRENLEREHYPNWTRREDGSITDGGIFADQTCIIPEHQRIWEYPAFYGRPVMPLKLEQVTAGISECEDETSVLHDDDLLLAIEILWTAYDQVDIRVRFILLMTALETIAGEEPGGDVPEYFQNVAAELRAVVTQRRKGSISDISRFLDRCDLKISQITDPSIMGGLRGLLCRVSGVDPADEKQVDERTQLYATINKLYGIRSGLAHGGKMRATDPNFYETLKSSLHTLEKLVTDAVRYRWQELRNQVS